MPNVFKKSDSSTKRPQRWDTPMDEEMSDSIVGMLMELPPFCDMDRENFPKRTPLEGILGNDSRIVQYEDGDVVIREGDYGSSAFLIMEGEIQIALKSLPQSMLGRSTEEKKTFWEQLSDWWNLPKVAEVRDSEQLKNRIGNLKNNAKIFLQDIPGVISADEVISLKAGEIFGEVAALSRTPRTATAVSHGKTKVLELRWQGLRDLIKYDTAWREHVYQLYRENNLNIHLRETPLFERLSKESVEVIAAETIFETYGEFDWHHKFQSKIAEDPSKVIKSEPIIEQEGEYTNGLVLIRNGFARLSRENGKGHQTLSYLGKGNFFGLRELYHNWKNEGDRVPWDYSLRAIGYVDILRIPTHVVETHILPMINERDIPEQFKSIDIETPKTPDESPQNDRSKKRTGEDLETGMLEFLVENRFINGTQAMAIDMDRCTRCDDCVRACASTHGNNPRFVREGETYKNLMIANACMHCIDPVCMIGCPTGAISRDAKTGSVTINEQTCIGCSTCANSCPYDNIRMVEIKDAAGLPIVDIDSDKPIQKATKCDLCHNQVAGPACQRACPHDALIRIDISEPAELKKWINR